MSLVDVKGVNYVPVILHNLIDIMSLRSVTLDADGELCGGVIEIPEDGNITKIGFRTGTVTVSDALKISLQTVDEDTGRPTGNLIHADAYGVQASVASNTTYWVSTQNPVAVTRGDIVAPVVEFNSYVAGNLQMLVVFGWHTYSLFPYIFSYTGLTWSLQARYSNFGLEYDDDIIEPVNGAFPALSVGSPSWDANDDPDRRGLRFSVPYNCRISGVYVLIDLDGDTDIELYDNDGVTLLETISLDSNVRGVTSRTILLKSFVTPIELIKNTFYRIILHPTTGTDITLGTFIVTDDGASEAMNALNGGVNFHYTTCHGSPVNEASWTQTATRRPLIGLMIDQLSPTELQDIIVEDVGIQIR